MTGASLTLRLIRAPSLTKRSRSHGASELLDVFVRGSDRRRQSGLQKRISTEAVALRGSLKELKLA